MGLAVYPRVVPFYQDIVIAGANVGLDHLEPPMRLALDAAQYWTAFVRNPDGTESFFWGRPPENLHLFFLGLALLPALLLATPVRIPRRLRLAAIGMVLLLASHVLAAIGLVHAQYHLRVVDPGSPFWDWIKTIANAWGQVITFALWGLLTWDVWLAKATRSADPPPPATTTGTCSRVSVP